LLLGIDDFAIRNGHTYNTGLHDLRRGHFLDIIPGRRGEALLAYSKKQDHLKALHPVAVVMDLVKAYHCFCQEWFPSAIRIADRFMSIAM
jgi:transposase